MPTSTYNPDIHGAAGYDHQDPKTKDIAEQVDTYQSSLNKDLYEEINKVKKPPSGKFKVNMADLRHGSKERAEEYDKRGWAHDETTYGHKDYEAAKIEPIKVTIPKVEEKGDKKLSTDVKLTTTPKKTDTKETVKKGPDLTTLAGRRKHRNESHQKWLAGDMETADYKANLKKVKKAGWKSFKNKLNKIIKPKKRNVAKKNDKEKNKKEVVINKGEAKKRHYSISEGWDIMLND